MHSFPYPSFIVEFMSNNLALVTLIVTVTLQADIIVIKVNWVFSFLFYKESPEAIITSNIVKQYFINKVWYI